MDFADKNYFDKLIENNSCYKISYYLCLHGKQWMMTVRHGTTLKFGKFTKFEPIPDEGFPVRCFDFVSYNQLNSRLNINQILTDYMACLRSISGLRKSGNPNKNTNVWRIMELENLNGDTMELTIWDDMARDFDVKSYKRLPKPVLVAVSSCRVTMYYENLQLTATPATHYYLNPDIEDIMISFNEYKAKYDSNPLLTLQKQPFEDVELEKMRNRYPLKDLLDQNPNRYKMDKFTTKATIIGLSTSSDWFYIACSDCSKKLTRRDGLLECYNHGPIQKQPKHVFKGFIADETAQIPMTFFSPAADAITDIYCDKMVMKLGYTDPHTLPDPLLKLRGMKKVFQFHFNKKNNVGVVDFVVDRIMDITVDNEGEPDTPTVQEEIQCFQSGEKLTTPTSTLNKRKLASIHKEPQLTSTKHVKRGLFQEQVDKTGKKQHLKDCPHVEISDEVTINKDLGTKEKE